MVRLHRRLTCCLPLPPTFIHRTTLSWYALVTWSKHRIFKKYSWQMSNLIHSLSFPSLSFLSTLLYSDNVYGYGGHDQHGKSLDWEPSEVRPFSRSLSVARIRRGRARRADSHSDRGGLPALQLPVSWSSFTLVCVCDLWGGACMEGSVFVALPNWVTCG